MRMLFSLRYYAVCLMLEHPFLQRMTSFALGSFESVSAAVCEYEDANLIWWNTPAYSLNDVKAMAWYKGTDSLIASWLEGEGFKEYPPYIDRLMQIGNNGIKIKKAIRSDSGSYWLSLTLASIDHKLKAVTQLEVIVAPSSQCKPNITEEGPILKAEVPSVGCGTPPLSPKWKNTNKTLIQEVIIRSLSCTDFRKDGCLCLTARDRLFRFCAIFMIFVLVHYHRLHYCVSLCIGCSARMC